MKMLTKRKVQKNLISKTKNWKKSSIAIIVFGYENMKKNPVYVSKKCCEEKQVHLLLIEEEGKRH